MKAFFQTPYEPYWFRPSRFTARVPDYFFFQTITKFCFFFIYLKKQEMQSLAIHELKNWK